MISFSKIKWALFGNDDDGPCGDEHFMPKLKCRTLKKILWWCRNPMHNLMFYVPPFGFANWDYVTQEEKILLKYFRFVTSTRRNPKTNQYKKLHWLGFKIPNVWEAYIGHRPDRGNLGFAFRTAH